MSITQRFRDTSSALKRPLTCSQRPKICERFFFADIRRRTSDHSSHRTCEILDVCNADAISRLQQRTITMNTTGTASSFFVLQRSLGSLLTAAAAWSKKRNPTDHHPHSYTHYDTVKLRSAKYYKYASTCHIIRLADVRANQLARLTRRTATSTWWLRLSHLLIPIASHIPTHWRDEDSKLAASNPPCRCLHLPYPLQCGLCRW